MIFQGQAAIIEKNNVLDVLMAEGYIGAKRVDPVLLTTLLEDLLVIPGFVNGRKILLPGPKFGLKHATTYIINCDKKNRCLKLVDVIDKLSSCAALNLILFQSFDEIEKVEQLICDEKCDEAYELINRIEKKLLHARIYFSTDFKTVENILTTLKRKIEIEKNIFVT